LILRRMRRRGCSASHSRRNRPLFATSCCRTLNAKRSHKVRDAAGNQTQLNRANAELSSRGISWLGTYDVTWAYPLGRSTGQPLASTLKLNGRVRRWRVPRRASLARTKGEKPGPCRLWLLSIFASRQGKNHRKTASCRRSPQATERESWQLIPTPPPRCGP